MPEEVLEPVTAPETAPRAPAEAALDGREVTPALEQEAQPEAKQERGSERLIQILSKVKPGSATAHDDDIDTDAQTVGALEDAEKKVHTLVELAQVKGVAHAVRVAKRMNDLYVLDTMHDELADKLYDGLLAKGLIAKE